MSISVQIRRKEFKYYIPLVRMDEVRERLLPHAVHDPFCADKPNNSYSVRSIYFDTTRLMFYHEKMDGLKVRKKLRVRVYDQRSDNLAAFLEIKRKIDDEIFKERARVPMGQAPNVLNGAIIDLLSGETQGREKIALDNFIYLIKRLNLQPRLLVTYEREAFQGLEDATLRITFDQKIRSFPMPSMDDLFREDDLKTYADPWTVLEVKFTGQMPIWIREILRDFSLRQQSISKYCLGLDAWRVQEEKTGPD